MARTGLVFLASTPLVLVGTSGCSGAFRTDSADPTVVTWAGPAGTYLELAPVDSPDSVALLIEISDTSWELRYGDYWRTAQESGTFDVSVDEDGYWVGASLMLPTGLDVGASAQGTTVLDQTSVETWYGTFEDAFVVDVWAGDFRGNAAFASGVGPIQLTWQGVDWDIIYYEHD